jgi:hypothetical protein
MAEMFVGTIHAFCLELLSCSSTATANKVDSRPLLT